MVKQKGDVVFNTFVYVLLAVLGAIALVPLLYVFSVSITPYSEVLKNGGYVIIPKSITFEAYKQLFSESTIPRAFRVTIIITVVGTFLNIVLTTLLAYPLSRKGFPGRKYILFAIVFTFIFNGGIIPTYLIVKSTGMLDSLFSMIVPNIIWSYNVLIMKSFFDNLPEELFESAKIDGAKEFRILWQIVVPLSTPVFLTLCLFYAVSHWNEFFQAIMYVSDRNLYPLQVVVRDILMQTLSSMSNTESMVPAVTMQMAAVISASLPIILVYPFIQKYFTKGMLLGAVKG
ncbi:ABC transporter permease [Paenibacillus ferrarius]|uniref:ABC transporter permease n=1 Tax=Paenibacillus ferrarius TaxID=1469647 RepID=A0A1V4HC05_9BACL|nr:carbohydrate ABC transporter permease [Paenibacillus ferrarius]OPH50426.1 ABC transporter permease [Paenibacillus ferrarius]